MKCLLNISRGSRCRRHQRTRSAQAIRWNMSCPGLDRDPKGAPISLLALDTDRSAMQRNQLLHQGKADPCSLMRARLRPFDPVKTFEQTRQLRFRDTDAGICYGKLCEVTAPPEPDGDAALERMLEGIREQVEHDLLPHLPVEVDRFGQRRAIHNQG